MLRSLLFPFFSSISSKLSHISNKVIVVPSHCILQIIYKNLMCLHFAEYITVPHILYDEHNKLKLNECMIFYYKTFTHITQFVNMNILC